MEEAAIEVLMEDDYILAVAKPVGMETIVLGKHAGDQRYCLTSRCRAERNLPWLAPGHRLDRDTSGAQIFAKTPEALTRLEDFFRCRKVEKSYLALCLGVPANAEGKIRRNLSDWGGGRRPVQVVKGKGGFTAESYYRLLARGELRPVGGSAPHRAYAVSLLLWQPRQGRTHQIRVHAAAFDHAILGDDQYGDRPANRLAKEACGLRRQALHCWRMRLPHPAGGRAVEIEAPLPHDMRTACEALAISLAVLRSVPQALP